MTADEIRKIWPHTADELGHKVMSLQLEREKVAQLAELNQQLREIVTEVKKKSVFGTIFG